MNNKSEYNQEDVSGGGPLTFPQRLASLVSADGIKSGKEHVIIGGFVLLCAVFIAGYTLYGAYFGSQTALLQRSLFYSMAAAGGLAWAGLKMKSSLLRIGVYLLALASLLPGLYLQENFLAIVRRGTIATSTEELLFIVVIVSVLALVKLYVGRAMVILSLLALAYAIFGDLIPGMYGNSGYSISRLTSHLFLSTNGVFGVPMGVAAQYIFLFSLFGAVLIRSGVGEIFVQLSYALTGRVQGGPGLAAVISSTLFGSINGSAVASVVTTGSFTIPLMKRTGYRPAVAGAIEAAASSAGQILPPVMGAAAFLMAEMTRIPYSTIALCALAPALLYVIAMLVAVRLEAGKDDLGRLDTGEVPSFRELLGRRLFLLLPLVVLVVGLIAGYTPMRSAAYSIMLALLMTLWSSETRLTLWDLVDLSVDTLKITISIIAAVAAAGILIGVLTLTGLALQISSLILIAGGDSLLLVLVFAMLASFVLGMGLPTSAAYLLLAILVAPALVEFGVPTIAAHMFIFYFGLVSAITPPVALAAYAGAAIAQSDPNRTAIEAIRLGFVKLVVPFLFVYSPGILLLGSTTTIVGDIAFAVIGICGLATAFSGWFSRPLSGIERLLICLASLAALMPSAAMDVLGSAVIYGIRVAGVLGLAGLVFYTLQKSDRFVKAP